MLEPVVPAVTIPLARSIAGVVPPLLVTLPVVPLTLVTVPTLIEPPRLVLVPLIVMAELANCALVTVPDRSVVGIVPEAVNALVPLTLVTLLLKVVQSAESNAPRFVADADGRLNVWVSVALEMLKFVPDVPVAKY